MGLPHLPDLAGLGPMRSTLHAIWSATSTAVELGHAPVGETSDELALMHKLVGERDSHTVRAVRELGRRGQVKIWDKHFEKWAGTVAPEAAKHGRDLLDSVRTRADAASELVKAREARPRPFIEDKTIKVAVKKPTSFAFPSGHAVDAYANAVVMSLLDPANAVRYQRQAEDIAMSRVVAGVHHPSDVIAGAMLGHAAAQEAFAASPLVASLRAVHAATPRMSAAAPAAAALRAADGRIEGAA